MNSSEFYSLVKKLFPFQPTHKQDIVLQQLSDFIFDNSPNSVYVLKGYAGTGKSTLIGLLSGLREENSNKEGQYLNFESMGTSYSLLNPQNVKRGDFGYVFQEAS